VFETETDILRGYAEGWQPDTAGHQAPACVRSGPTARSRV